jgi:Flp pilus assembly protein TadG
MGSGLGSYGTAPSSSITLSQVTERYAVNGGPMARRRKRPRPRGLRLREHGAVAAELAVILPILAVLAFGIIEFGRVFNTQISLTGAAREGARVMAIHNDEVATRSATITAAAMNPSPTVTVTPAPCSRGDEVTVRAQRQVAITVPFFGDPTFDLTGVGVMRCGG